MQQLQIDRSLDQVVAAMTERYAVDDDRARSDATSLLDALLAAGAIIRS